MNTQKYTNWDDTFSKDWPVECQEIEIKSSKDGKLQKAYFYSTKGTKPRPLVVSLHTWSSNYQQEDALSYKCVNKNYNYIHPDFRGPNFTFESCGSPLVISDIDDAIDYSIKNGNVDLNSIHVIGVSGGGYATLLTYMNSKHNIKTFSAWSPISNLVDWYYESEGRNAKYAKHIAMVTNGCSFENKPYYLNLEEAKKRSPIYMHTPVKKREHSNLFIYHGIHDGYTGSVPITHSIRMYNKIIQDFNPKLEADLIPSCDIIKLLTYRRNTEEKGSLIGRRIHYDKKHNNSVRVVIFEGTHEMLIKIALKKVNKKNEIYENNEKQ